MSPLATIDRYLVRESAIMLCAAAVVLLLIATGGNTARLLGLAAEGRLPADIVPAMLGYGMGQAAILILPAATFIALLLTFGRLSRDGEMTALAAAGIGPFRLYRALAWLIVPLAVVQGLLTLQAAPWMSAQIDTLRADAAQRSELLGVVPGRFTSSQRGGVIFVESMGADRARMGSIFIYMPGEEGVQIILADGGERRVDPQSGERYLVLFDGNSYEGRAGEGRFRITGFESQGILVPEPTVDDARQHRKSIPSGELLRSADPRRRAELQWRLSFPVSTLLLALLALPLSHSSPREGRFARLTVGILIYAIYVNLLTTGRSWLAAGVTPEWLGLWWVHGLVGAIVLLLVARQNGLLRLARAGRGRVAA